jgi:hypothetical protein
MVTRYRLHWWELPTKPGAFTEVHVPSCYHQPGQCSYYDKLPTYVRVQDVIRAKRGSL